MSERDDKVVEVEEPEKEAVVECFTTPKKQNTLLEKLLGKQFEGNQTTIIVSENEIVQADISYYKSPSPSVKRAALLLENVEKLVFLHENLQFD